MHNAILDLVKIVAAWVVGGRITGVEHVNVEIHF
jgi:hypothetical protein